MLLRHRLGVIVGLELGDHGSICSAGSLPAPLMAQQNPRAACNLRLARHELHRAYLPSCTTAASSPPPPSPPPPSPPSSPVLLLLYHVLLGECMARFSIAGSYASRIISRFLGRVYSASRLAAVVVLDTVGAARPKLLPACPRATACTQPSGVLAEADHGCRQRVGDATRTTFRLIGEFERQRVVRQAFLARIAAEVARPAQAAVHPRREPSVRVQPHRSASTSATSSACALARRSWSVGARTSRS